MSYPALRVGDKVKVPIHYHAYAPPYKLAATLYGSVVQVDLKAHPPNVCLSMTESVSPEGGKTPIKGYQWYEINRVEGVKP